MKKLLLILLFIAAFLERTVFDLGPNVELVTAAMILSAYFAGRKMSFWLTFAIVATTDRIIGNSNIFIFTWSGFLIPALTVGTFFKGKKLTGIKKYLLGTGAGISSNIFFFLWTNFGVWLIGTMHPKTISGLILSYVYGLPFLKPQLISSLIFIPLGFFLIEKSKNLMPVFKSQPLLARLKNNF